VVARADCPRRAHQKPATVAAARPMTTAMAIAGLAKSWPPFPP